MGTSTSQAFDIDAGFSRIHGQFPSSDDLRNALLSEPGKWEPSVVRLWLSEGIPFAFRECPAVYEALRGWLGRRLNVHPKQITLIGSARIGYSLAPSPDYGRTFGNNSDLDLSIVSAELFERVRATHTAFAADYAAGVVQPRNAREQKFWDWTVGQGRDNFARGFFDPNKIPTLDRYPVARKIVDTMWRLKQRLDATRGAPLVRAASVRVYRDWAAFVNRVSGNLMSAIASAPAFKRRFP